MSGTVTTMQCTGIVQEMVVRRKSFTITASLCKDGIRMNNYYYDAPPDFMPDETVTFEVEMEQPPGGYSHLGDFVSRGEAHFGYKKDDGNWDIVFIDMPYPRGARVGVREAWQKKLYTRERGDHYVAQPASTMPDDAIRHRYTVTAVDVVNQDGRWVERVTMRRET